MIEYLLSLFRSGLGSLVSYLAAHVILCLIPAFFIAGALSVFIPKEAITRYLGKDASKWVSYPASAIGGFVLAVCSCTIMPLFASIYKKGAGIGPAMTFLFIGPAVNILAISFTGVQIGMDIALARLVLSIIFGVGIGLIMAKVFKKEDEARLNELDNSQVFSQQAKVPKRNLILLLVFLLILLAGTLQLGLLTNSYFSLTMNSEWIPNLQSYLTKILPPDPSLGIEGISVHGLTLILLLVLVGISAFLGFNKIDRGFTTWSFIALSFIILTLLFAAINFSILPQGISINFTGKFIAELVLLTTLIFLMAKSFKKKDIQDWLWETWRFIKQIIPILLIGVFVAGVARGLIPAKWITSIAGKNTILANFIGVVFGVFMYFPTLVEVPIAKTFLNLGMARGPLLAYLLADPELSVQSIMITNSVIGKKKTMFYVILVTIFSTLSGLLFGLIIK